MVVVVVFILEQTLHFYFTPKHSMNCQSRRVRAILTFIGDHVGRVKQHIHSEMYKSDDVFFVLFYENVVLHLPGHLE